MSPDARLDGRVSSLISLRRLPIALGHHHRGMQALNTNIGDGSGRWGVVRSEIKEEGRPFRPGPGDIRGVRHPGGLIPRSSSAHAFTPLN